MKALRMVETQPYAGPARRCQRCDARARRAGRAAVIIKTHGLAIDHYAIVCGVVTEADPDLQVGTVALETPSGGAFECPYCADELEEDIPGCKCVWCSDRTWP